MASESDKHTTKRGWRAKLGIGLLAATALTGVVAEVTPSAPASAATITVETQAAPVNVKVVYHASYLGSSWT
jgi:hypothetical protein